MNNKILFLTLVLTACLSQFASDIYTPAITAIATSLNSSLDLIQFSMAIYMFGVAISQLIYGPISEGVGRKAPLVVGIGIMLIGTLTCISAQSIDTLLIGRFIQGCGAGAAAALWRTLFRDLYSGEQLAKLGAYLSIFVTFIIPAAPALGGYLTHYFSWRANFIFLGCYSLVTWLLVIFVYKETSQGHHLERLKPRKIVEQLKQLLSSRVFMGITLCTFLTYGGLFSWLTVGPVLLIHLAGLSPVQFGWVSFLGGGFAFICGGRLNGRYVSDFGMANMMRFGWGLMFISSLLLLIGFGLFGINAWAIIIPYILFTFAATFIWANAFAQAFTPFGHIAGYAGSLYGFMQLGGGAFMGAIVSHLPDDNPIPLALVLIIASLGAWFCFEKVVKPKT